MSISRRGFLAGILATASAPAFVREVMRLRPVSPVWWGADYASSAMAMRAGLRYSDALRKELANAVIQAAAGATLKLYSGAPGGGKMLAKLKLGLPMVAAADGTIHFEDLKTAHFDPPPGLLTADSEIVDKDGKPLFSGPVNLREWSVRQRPGETSVEVCDLRLAFDE